MFQVTGTEAPLRSDSRVPPPKLRPWAPPFQLNGPGAESKWNPLKVWHSGAKPGQVSIQ